MSITDQDYTALSREEYNCFKMEYVVWKQKKMKKEGGYPVFLIGGTSRFVVTTGSKMKAIERMAPESLTGGGKQARLRLMVMGEGFGKRQSAMRTRSKRPRS